MPQNRKSNKKSNQKLSNPKKRPNDNVYAYKKT